MLRIAWQTLRTRRATLSGAFVAIFLAVTLTYATGLAAGRRAERRRDQDASPPPTPWCRADPTVTLGHGDEPSP